MKVATKNTNSTKKTWPMVRLGDVCKIIAGQSPEGANYTDDPSFVEFHQGCKAFGNKYLDRSGVYTKVVTKIAKSGSLLMSVRAPVGKLNITQRDVCIGRGLAAFSACDSLNQDYLYFCLLAGTEKLNKVAGAGTVFPSISCLQLASFTFLLPPLPIQREIVARLEKELGEADALAAKFKEIAGNGDAEFKAELDETFKNVEGEKVCLGDVCEKVIDCPHTTAPDEGAGIPLVRTPNIGVGRLVYEKMHRVSEFVYQERTKRGVPECGDLIFAREAPAGNVAVIQESEKVCLGQRTVLLKLNRSMCDSDYLAYSILAPSSQKELVSFANGSTVSHVNVCDIKRFSVLLPSLPAQCAIVAKLDSAKAKCEKLKAAAERGLRAAEDLRKAILSEAFEQQ